MANIANTADHLLTTPKRRRGYRYDEEKVEQRKRELADARERQWLDEMDRMSPEHGHCYFFGCDEGIVKIGYSKNLNLRLRQVQYECPFRLTILAKATGADERELYYHRKFAEHRLFGEWFNLHPDILAEIDHLNFTPSLGRGGA